tara:strand:- start:4031 stop:5782 length:1752 start_codon:yes stop_codon:yes gene_type:complete
MAKQNITFEIDGQPAGTPANLGEITLSANWGNREGVTENEISTTSIDFVLEDAKKINQHVADGLTGGVGIFEGIPYKIALNEQNIFDGYIDLTNDADFIENERVIANVVKTGGSDWLNDVADGFSFGFLRQQNFIKDSDYVVVPYVLNFRPEAFIIGQLSISFYILQKELIQNIRDIADNVANVIEAFGKVNPVGEIITASLKLTAQIAYSTAIAIALIQVIKDLINQFFPPVRRYRAMTFKRMFEVGLNFLGLDFQSTIFDDATFKNSVFLPTKSERGGILGKTDKFGHPNQNSAIYNFGDFIRTMLSMFNANYKIQNDTFIFERRDYWDNLSTYILPDVETNQSDRLSELQYNTDEFVKNYFISFQTDIQDQNTLEKFTGTNYQIINTPINTTNQKMTAGKGLAQIRPPFARGVRKEGLTVYEKTLLTIANLADSVVNTLGQKSKLGATIKKRAGMLTLSADTTAVDKFLFMRGQQMQKTQISAKLLWDNFHFIESFAEITDTATGKIIHNQHVLQTGEKIPFCLDDWNKLLNNNKFNTVNGQTGEIISIDWDFQQGIANISYKIKQLYTKNIILVFNDGQ